MKQITIKINDEDYALISAKSDGNISGYMKDCALSHRKPEEMFETIVTGIASLDAAMRLLEKNMREPAAIQEMVPHRPLRASMGPSNGPISDEMFRYTKYVETGEWSLKTAPDGSTDGYFSEYHNGLVKVIVDRRGNEEVIKYDDPLYAEF